MVVHKPKRLVFFEVITVWGRKKLYKAGFGFLGLGLGPFYKEPLGLFWIFSRLLEGKVKLPYWEREKKC